MFLLGELTFPSSIKAMNLMKDGKNSEQSVNRSQALVKKLNGWGNDTIRFREMYCPGVATEA